jgi:hypothetical protein
LSSVSPDTAFAPLTEKPDETDFKNIEPEFRSPAANPFRPNPVSPGAKIAVCKHDFSMIVCYSIESDAELKSLPELMPP